jgi:DNA-3-methyladenine glycosylase
VGYIKGGLIVLGVARVGREFYELSSPKVARLALGKILVRVNKGMRISGTIVETEAYRGARDPASHAYSGKTKRNEVMFGEAGHAYVYLSYGVHQCLNLTAEPLGTPAAVLVRALEPSEGIETMKRNRGVEVVRELTSGPGKLTEALGITSGFDGEDMVTSKRLFLEEGKQVNRIRSSTRIGVSVGADRKWRFYIEGNEFVSRGRPS